VGRRYAEGFDVEGVAAADVVAGAGVAAGVAGGVSLAWRAAISA
jgi:hypothetical protein